MSDDLHKKSGPLLLLAGPGTGKTYRLGKRIKYLVDEVKVPPDQITVITFTAAAAANMRDTISDDTRPELYVEPAKQPGNIRTMHSLGFRILKDDLAALPFSCQQVVNDADLQLLLCEDAAQLVGANRSDARAALESRQVGQAKALNRSARAICEQYQAILRCCSAIDHDDQILLPCELFSNKPDLLAKYQAQCRHLLVDEYQDINAAQFQLIRQLAGKSLDGLFVVGDDDQSIYSWRGGSPEFIRRFRDDFGGKASVASLDLSFRCHRHTMEGALAVVGAFDSNRLTKPAFQYKVKDGKKIQIHSAASDEKEARVILGIVQDALPSRDVLILVPHRRFAVAVTKALAQARISFSAPPSAPGRGLIAAAGLAKWLRNQNDSIAFRECLRDFLDCSPHVPSKQARKPEKRIERENILLDVSQLWRQVLAGEKQSLWEALLTPAVDIEIHQQARQAFLRLRELVKGKDVAAFAAAVVESLKLWNKPSAMLDEIEQWVSLFERASPHGQVARVRIMTFQGAKGLQARVVCVLGVEEGTVPRGEEPAQLAEEARLFYVTATRAIDELHLFHARKRSGNIIFRNIFRPGAPPDLRPSRFLSRIDPAHYEQKYHRS